MMIVFINTEDKAYYLTNRHENIHKKRKNIKTTSQDQLIKITTQNLITFDHKII